MDGDQAAQRRVPLRRRGQVHVQAVRSSEDDPRGDLAAVALTGGRMTGVGRDQPGHFLERDLQGPSDQWCARARGQYFSSVALAIVAAATTATACPLVL